MASAAEAYQALQSVLAAKDAPQEAQAQRQCQLSLRADQERLVAHEHAEAKAEEQETPATTVKRPRPCTKEPSPSSPVGDQGRVEYRNRKSSGGFTITRVSHQNDDPNSWRKISRKSSSVTRKFFPWFMPPPPPLPIKKSSQPRSKKAPPSATRHSPLTPPPPSSGPTTTRRPSPTPTSICTLSRPTLEGSVEGGHGGSLELTIEDMVACLPDTDEAQLNLRAYHGANGPMWSNEPYPSDEAAEGVEDRGAEEEEEEAEAEEEEEEGEEEGEEEEEEGEEEEEEGEGEDAWGEAGESESCFADEETGDQEEGEEAAEGGENGEEEPWEGVRVEEEEGMQVGSEPQGEAEGEREGEVASPRGERDSGAIANSGWGWEATSDDQVVCLQIEGRIWEGPRHQGEGDCQWQVQAQREEEGRVMERGGEQECYITIQEPVVGREAGRAGAGPSQRPQGRGEEARDRVDVNEMQCQARRMELEAWGQAQRQHEARHQRQQQREALTLEGRREGQVDWARGVKREHEQTEENEGPLGGAVELQGRQQAPRYDHPWPTLEIDRRLPGHPQDPLSHPSPRSLLPGQRPLGRAQGNMAPTSPRTPQQQQQQQQHALDFFPSPHVVSGSTTSTLGAGGRVTTHTTNINEHTTFLTSILPPAAAPRAPAAMMPSPVDFGEPRSWAGRRTPSPPPVPTVEPQPDESIADLERAAAQALFGLHRDASRSRVASEGRASFVPPTMAAPSALQTYLSYYATMWPNNANPPAFHQATRHDLR